MSVATASRVLNGRPDALISPATQAQVLAAAERLGYRPNPVARALVTGRHSMIGLALPYLWYPFAPEVMHHVQRELGTRGFGVITQGADTDPERYTSDLNVVEPHVDGVVAIERADLVRLRLAQSRPLSVPLVSAGADVVEEVDWVRVDLRSGAEAALRHLLATGCRRVIYMVPQISHHPGEVRQAAYEAVMAEAGLPVEYLVVPGGNRVSARQAIVAYVPAHGVPDGIFCCNDVTAVGAYRGLRDLGIRIPSDCRLVGCDGIEGAEYLDCPLSTIVQPIEQMCRLACDFLLNRIENPKTPQQTATLPAPLTIRQSSGG